MGRSQNAANLATQETNATQRPVTTLARPSASEAKDAHLPCSDGTRSARAGKKKGPRMASRRPMTTHGQVTERCQLNNPESKATPQRHGLRARSAPTAAARVPGGLRYLRYADHWRACSCCGGRVHLAPCPTSARTLARSRLTKLGHHPMRSTPSCGAAAACPAAHPWIER
eukprot:366111-Chlamydomonas_euryale.AAC.22